MSTHKVLTTKPDGFLIQMSTHKVLTTKPDGFLIEMSTHKVLTTKPDGFLIEMSTHKVLIKPQHQMDLNSLRDVHTHNHKMSRTALYTTQNAAQLIT
jgi:hypothetical protein